MPCDFVESLLVIKFILISDSGIFIIFEFYYSVMRLLSLSFLIFALVPWSVFNFASAESQEGRFEWSESRPLQWSDFNGQPGTVPPGFERPYEIAAFTFTWSESQWRFEKTSSTSCQYKITQMNIPAYFLPYSSWIKPEYENDYLLKHEQGLQE